MRSASVSGSQHEEEAAEAAAEAPDIRAEARCTRDGAWVDDRSPTRPTRPSEISSLSSYHLELISALLVTLKSQTSSLGRMGWVAAAKSQKKNVNVRAEPVF